MDEVSRVRELLARYCQLMDDRRYAEWSQLFTADGIWALGGKEHHGPAEAKAYMDQLLRDRPQRRTRHFNTNLLIELDGTQGRVTSDYAVLSSEPEGAAWTVVFIGRYFDRVVRKADSSGWQFAERRLGTAADRG
ncbi:MAG: nuclear transport factor 2 family protein [Chloroflexi bacterium]|nr:nuclear transport factor 2 family protein [Chloroflexota bacterium]MBV9596195.1 nuclear transport factor 2 family protein [Chloroflexota bacterium]